ncbi:MAG: hypothetical protein AAGN66_00520 [Acidobacteriota bacterium]
MTPPMTPPKTFSETTTSSRRRGGSFPPSRFLRALGLATVLLATTALATGCGGGGAGTGAAPAGASSAAGAASVTPPELRLTLLMGHLQTYTDKVGHAVRGQNAPLATFYLDRVDMALGAVAEIETWDGMAVGMLAEGMMRNSLSQLRGHVDRSSWEDADATYRAVTLACTGCHVATRREYIAIVPVEGPSPWGQSFAVP